MKLSYRQLALVFVAVAAVLTGLYATLFYFGTILLNDAGITTGGVDAITGGMIKIACAVPFVLLSWAALAFRKQLATGADQGLG